MNNEMIQNDEKFKNIRKEYNLLYQSFDVYDDVIVHDTPKPYVHVIFDKNYNVIGIHREYIPYEKREEIASSYYDIYTKKPSKDMLPYPFSNYSISDIMKIGNSLESTSYYSYLASNKVSLSRSTDDYYDILSYLKFLEREIQKYYLNCYRMVMQDLDYPDVYTYLKGLTSNIYYAISLAINSKSVPSPIYILEYLGILLDKYDEYAEGLQAIISLKLKEVQEYRDNREVNYMSSLASDLHDTMLKGKKKIRKMA